jgi:hypothetical protein
LGALALGNAELRGMASAIEAYDEKKMFLSMAIASKLKSEMGYQYKLSDKDLNEIVDANIKTNLSDFRESVFILKDSETKEKDVVVILPKNISEKYLAKAKMELYPNGIKDWINTNTSEYADLQRSNFTEQIKNIKIQKMIDNEAELLANKRIKRDIEYGDLKVKQYKVQ